MKRQAYLLSSAVAVTLAAFSATAETLPRPAERNSGTPAAERAARVRGNMAGVTSATNAAAAANHNGTDWNAAADHRRTNWNAAADHSATNAAGAADNTVRNVRDQDERTLTPLGQGSSQSDVDTTAQIRKEVMAGRNMSMNAQNVKVITRDGRVTLRGPVDSVEEKLRIGRIAARAARTGSVDNQLETVAASRRQ